MSDRWFQPILDLIKALVQPEKGSKFLVSALAIAGIVFLHWKGISTDVADAVIGVLAIAYFIADITHKKNMASANETNKDVVK